MTDLSLLIERIEKSEGADRELDHAIYEALGKPVVRMASASTHGTDLVNWAPFYSASLDAAVTLVPDGWYWRAGHGVLWSGWAHLNLKHPDYCDRGDEHSAHAETPALALCACALKARNHSHEG